MTDFNHILQQGSANAWLFLPTAILLGALHGLEPGHSKTMMAAFIIAIRGTVIQAVLLGLSAAFSHSLIIWLLAVVALHYGSQWNAESTEPYFQIASAIIIIGLALWMFWRTRRDVKAAHDHDPAHLGGDAVVINTGHGTVQLSIFEEGVPPVFRISAGSGKIPEASSVTIETIRANGARESFQFAEKAGSLESTTSIPEPHEFDITLTLAHGDHAHAFPAKFHEGGHHHEHLPEGAEYQDAHEAAHALDIQKRFANRAITTPQIMVFGFTGGLLPCPAAFTVLLVCMQVKKFTLGFALVAAFSLGLAITMVTVGAVAAWSVQHAGRKFGGFGNLMRRAPYLSSAVLILLAIYMAVNGWRGLAGHG